MSGYKFGLKLAISTIALMSVAGASFASPADDKAQSGSDAEHDTIVVTARRHIISGKTGVPIEEVPQNIQVLSGALLKDQGAVILDDALRNVAGVMPGGYYNGYDYYRIRGFDSSTSTYLDGLLFFNGISQSTEISGLDRVEVAKGPPSSLYGQASLGGIVNLVSKRPTSQPFGNLEITGGTHDFYDAELDINHPLTADGKWLGRIDTIYRHTGSYVDYADGNRRVYIAPSATWKIDKDTTLTLLFKYQNDHSELAMPLPAAGTVLDNANGEIDQSTYAGNANDPGTIDQWRAHAGYEFTHRFNETFKIRQNFRATQGQQKWKDLLYPSALESDDRTLKMYPYSLRSRESNIAVDTAVDAHFENGPVKQAITVGVDYRWNGSQSQSQQINYSDSSSYYYLDLFDPQYSDFTPQYARVRSRTSGVTTAGLYFQDAIKLYDTFTITVGGRQDSSSSRSNGVSSKDNAFTPRFGLTWEFRPNLYAYTSYSESFTPQVGYDGATGEQLSPERGKMAELGLKSTLMHGRLNSTVSIYDLKRSNVAIDDPDSSGSYINAGSQRARGLELDSQLEVTDNLELILAYSHVKAENAKDQIVDGDVMTKGSRLQNVPADSLSTWIRYRFTDGALNGLALSLGGSHYSDQAGDIPDTFSLPAYTLINANVAYKFGSYKIQFNVRNLTDETYYTGSYNTLYVLPGHPRTFQLTLSKAF
ncbi:MAG: TonB-dependent siderophore receptor [Asticcacaulis sp.]|uniref:TonB-dependent siderophore receptor n=1 Tax=Asticcacaulis sp. TaxID=1872648 RepID=UPI0039E4425F